MQDTHAERGDAVKKVHILWTPQLAVRVLWSERESSVQYNYLYLTPEDVDLENTVTVAYRDSIQRDVRNIRDVLLGDVECTCLMKTEC